MRIFGSDRMDGMLQKLGLKEGEAIVHPWINKALERAQKKVEARNFDIRRISSSTTMCSTTSARSSSSSASN